jgi:hypothetical protein
MASRNQLINLNSNLLDEFVERKNEIFIPFIVSYFVLGISIYAVSYLLLHYLIKVTNRLKELEKRFSFLEKNTDDNFRININNMERITEYVEEIQEKTNMNINSIIKNLELLSELIDRNKNNILKLEHRFNV